MYLHYVKATVVDALRQTFNENFPVAEFRNLPISIDYPVKEIDYPGIWIDFDPVGPLSNVGVGYVEKGESGKPRYRWRFAGSVSMTVVALSSLERDRLFDMLVSTMAFSKVEDNRSKFREVIEEGEYIGMNMDFDQIDQRGFGTAQGTPWGSDDMVYEATIAMETIGEFTSDELGEVVLVSGLNLIVWVTGTLAPDGAGGLGWVEEVEPPHLDTFG